MAAAAPAAPPSPSGPKTCDMAAVLPCLPRRRRDAIFSTGVAPRQRHDLPATSTRFCSIVVPRVAKASRPSINAGSSRNTSAPCCGFDLRQAKAPKLTPATRKAAELIDDLVRLEAAKGFLEKSTLIKRIIALPSLQEPPSNEKFTRLSTVERIRCVTRVGNCFDQRFDKHLCVEPDAVIAAWRRTIVAAGGITASTQPLLRRLTSRAPLENEWKPRSCNHKDGAGAANLHSLLAAYGAVGARRELRMRGDSSFYASSVVSSSSASSNSISLSKTWPSSSTSPKAPSRSMSD